jgi:alpha-galactosidase
VKHSIGTLFRSIGISGLSLLSLANIASAGGKSLAPTPPMGWNSWDSYGTDVREDQVKANADVMALKLAKLGWQYVVVDIEWYVPNAEGHDYKAGAPVSMDAYGRLIPAENSLSLGSAWGRF